MNQPIKVYEPGEKMDIDWRKQDINFICCDCGLWHRLRFAVVGSKLRMRVWRVAGEEQDDDLELSLNPRFIAAMEKIMEGFEESDFEIERVRKVDTLFRKEQGNE